MDGDEVFLEECVKIGDGVRDVGQERWRGVVGGII
jgi:hypothetical protein